MRYSSLTMVLPTLNEAENISQLLDSVISGHSGINILVVDDSSSDSTIKIAKSKNYGKLVVIERAGPRGLTASIIEGIAAARTPFIIVMDSDFQHPPEKIREIFSLLEDGSDLVVACRREVRGWPIHRKVISNGAGFLANLRLLAFGCPRASDVLSGYFGARRNWVADSIHRNPKRFETSGYKFLFDLLKGEKSGRLSISETPYVFNGRKRGKSKIGLGHILRFFRSLFI